MANAFWTETRDIQLRVAEQAGLSAAQIAKLLGTTRSAVLGRSARLRGVIFKSEVERTNRAVLAREKRSLVESRAIVDMATNLANGMQRNEAIAKAHVAGARWAAIARHLGITRQAAHLANVQFTAQLDRAMNAAALAASPYGPGGAYPSVRSLRREQKQTGR